MMELPSSNYKINKTKSLKTYFAFFRIFLFCIQDEVNNKVGFDLLTENSKYHLDVSKIGDQCLILCIFYEPIFEKK